MDLEINNSALLNSRIRVTIQYFGVGDYGRVLAAVCFFCRRNRIITLHSTFNGLPVFQPLVA